MANVPSAIKHLPLLHNPLINAIFNNPFHDTSPTRRTIRELGENHLDYAILVPPAHILNNAVDPSKRKLSDLCYNDENYVQSHIIDIANPYSISTAPVSKAQLIICNTLNGRQVLLKGGILLTGKNFKKSIRVKILCVQQFSSFCDYFPKGSRFFLMFIEDSLLYNNQESQIVSNQEPRFGSRDSRKEQKREVTFEDLLRSFPVLSRSMSEKFYTLFHHNNRKLEKLGTRKIMKFSEIEKEFRTFEAEAFSIVQDSVNSNSVEGDRIYNLLDSVVTKHPSLDMNQLICEYVELNLYDKVWQQIVYQYQDASYETTTPNVKKVLTSKLYKDLSCLSLNQLDVPLEDPWSMNILQKRIAEAITILSNLLSGDVSNQKRKVAIIGEAVDVLTSNSKNDALEDLVIDADTFIGLLIMVVVHSKLLDLEAHLIYIRHFGPSGSSHGNEGEHIPEKNYGYLNYILSNFDAVIFLLSPLNEAEGDEHLSNLIQASANNYKFWYAIKTEDEMALMEIFSSVETSYGKQTLPRSHFIRSKNIHGESCFNFAVKSKNVKVFKLLMDKTASWILLEEFIFDKNTSTNQNLLMIALQEEAHDIASEIVLILESNCNLNELKLYYNSQDKYGRTVGHYLSHNLEVLDRVARFIDWAIKDSNSQTPVTAMCRCYDHANYELLIHKLFTHIFDRTQSSMTFDDQIDKNGNNLLHILSKGIPESKLLSNSRSLIDINKLNNKQLTPLALYVRYSRAENLRTILKADHLIFDIEDPKSFYNVLDYYSFSASKQSPGQGSMFKTIEKLVLENFFANSFPQTSSNYFGLLNSRFDATLNDWIVNVAQYRRNTNEHFSTKYVSIHNLYQFYHFYKRSSQLCFIPLPKMIAENFMNGKSPPQTYSKFCINRSLKYLNCFMSSAHYLDDDARKYLHKMFLKFLFQNSSFNPSLMKTKAKQRFDACNEESIKLTQSKINEMKFFIEYSLQDTKHYMLLMKKLKKVSTMVAAKQRENRYLYDRFLVSLNSTNSEQNCHLYYDMEVRDIDGLSQALEPFCLWLELCADELLSNCDLLLSKISRWEGSYAKIKELNGELNHMEEQFRAVEKENTQAETNGEERQRQTLERKNTLSVELMFPETDIPEDTSFFNFGLGDSKRERYKKILVLKSDGVKCILALNQEIKMDHEILAASISQFLTYRSNFLTLGIKNLAKTSINLLKLRQFELRRYLSETRISSLKL